MKNPSRRDVLKAGGIAGLFCLTRFSKPLKASPDRKQPQMSVWERARSLSEVIVSGLDGTARRGERDTLGPAGVLGNGTTWRINRSGSHYILYKGLDLGVYSYSFIPADLRNFDLPLVDTPKGGIEGGACFMFFNPKESYELSASRLICKVSSFAEGDPFLRLTFEPVSRSDAGKLVEVHAYLNCFRDAYRTAGNLSTHTVYKMADGWQSGQANTHPLLPRSLGGVRSLFGISIKHDINYERVAGRVLRCSEIEEAVHSLKAGAKHCYDEKYI